MEAELTYEVVWQRVGDALKQELVDFWMVQRALPSREAAEDRAQEVAVVARDAGRIAALATVRVTYVPRMQNAFYQFRMFVAPEHRRQRVGAELLLQVARYFESEFNAGRAGNCIGILMVIEHTGLQAAVTDAVTPTGPEFPLPLIFMGVDEKGNHLRIYYFKGAQIVPPYRI